MIKPVSWTPEAPTTGKLGGLSNGNAYQALFFDTQEAARAKAADLARSGFFGIIYESKEFQRVRPVPVEVEQVVCCGPTERK